MLPPLTVFDIETTGLDPKRGHRIIELAAVRIENNMVMKERPFHALINPERDIPIEAKQVHRITEADLANAPTIMTILPEFLAYAQGSVLVAHNAAFDYGFLTCEKEFCWGYIDLPECLCTMRLSQSLFPAEFRHNLDALCQRFGIARQLDRHRALTDVLLTAEALQKLLAHGRISSIDDLRKRAGLQQLAAAGR